MTQHYYSDKITAQQIWDGWVYHGYGMPAAFVQCTTADSIAYNMWSYLAGLDSDLDMMEPKEWCAQAPTGELRETLESTLKELLVLYWENKTCEPSTEYECSKCGYTTTDNKYVSNFASMLLISCPECKTLTNVKEHIRTLQDKSVDTLIKEVKKEK